MIQQLQILQLKEFKLQQYIQLLLLKQVDVLLLQLYL